jgi:hypothetical protein
MVTTTTATTTTTALSLSAGAIAGIVIGAIVFVVFVFWLTSFFRLYAFYKVSAAGAPNEAYKASENDCANLLCISLNQWLVVKFDPSLEEAVQTRNVFLKVENKNVVGFVTPTTAPFLLTPSALAMHAC